MKKTISLVMLGFLLCSPAWGTTLLDIDWATGNTSSATNIKDGVFTYCSLGSTDASNQFGIGTGDGPGGRNYLVVKQGGLTCILSDTSPSMNNPSTIYVRFWFRKHTHFGSNCHMFMLYSSGHNTGEMYIMRGYSNGFSFIPSLSDSNYAFNYTGTLNLNQWYRLEYKILNAGTSNATVSVRLDGENIDDYLISDHLGGDLDSKAGTLTIPSLNYVNVTSYNSWSGTILDIAGLKITDGPDWIGDGSDTIPNGSDTVSPAIPSGVITGIIE
ncbi:MAG TPA: hypothetical protein PLX41_07025 [Bacteroidales bacterium]|nr:hypothetical protein [Bacteroidales bacterium]